MAAPCRERGRSGSTSGGLGGAGGGGESELQLQRRRLRDRQKTLRAQLGEVRPAMLAWSCGQQRGFGGLDGQAGNQML